MARQVRIRPAEAPDIAVVAGLFREYAASLGIDLAYQGFDAELIGLPGAYAAPDGALLLAVDAAGKALGCVAVRALKDDLPGALAARRGERACEMKRLYARPEVRGAGVGRALVVAAIEAATELGYRSMWLDTLADMRAAQGLYRSLGFTETEPYYETPVAGTVFMRRALG